MDISKQTIERYVNDVISSKPVPGGGSVSALIGSQGAALAGMLVALTTGKKIFKTFTKDEQTLFHQLGNFFEVQKNRLMQLASDDVDAYNGFLTALRLPKATEEEKALRHKKMQTAQLQATDVPLEMAKTAFDTLECVQPVVEKGNVNAISDAAVGAMCLNLAIQGGLYNVRINLPGLDDVALCEKLDNECKVLKKQADEMVEAILATVEKRLGK